MLRSIIADSKRRRQSTNHSITFDIRTDGIAEIETIDLDDAIPDDLDEAIEKDIDSLLGSSFNASLVPSSLSMPDMDSNINDSTTVDTTSNNQDIIKSIQKQNPITPIKQSPPSWLPSSVESKSSQLQNLMALAQPYNTSDSLAKDNTTTIATMAPHITANDSLLVSAIKPLNPNINSRTTDINLSTNNINLHTPNGLNYLPQPMLSDQFTSTAFASNASHILNCKHTPLDRILLNQLHSHISTDHHTLRNKCLIVMILRGPIRSLSDHHFIILTDESGTELEATIDGASICLQWNVQLHFGMTLLLSDIHLFRSSHAIITNDNILSIYANVHFIS